MVLSLLKKVCPDSRSGFTLLEVVVSVVLVAVISAASWTTVSVATKASESSRGRLRAVNLMQKSFEEIRSFAQNTYNYNLLNSCQFPSAQNPSNVCNFDDISLSNPEFTRTLTVTNQSNTANLKNAQVVITWNEFGTAKEMRSSILLTNPPASLPGNIVGKVYNATQPSQLLGGALITITNSVDSSSHQTTASPTLDPNGRNYDFKDPVTNVYIVNPNGTWSMQVVRAGYQTYTIPSIVVNSNQITVIDVPMTPNPANATITANVTNINAGGIVVPSFNNGKIQLYDDGALVSSVTNQNSQTFTIPFNNTTQQCFTLRTQDAFVAGYAFNASGAGCTFPYLAHGWSSAQVNSNGAINCIASSAGNQSLDRICVNPGDNLVQNIPLVPIPTATVTGQVFNGNTNQPIAGATIEASWPPNAGWGAFSNTVLTDSTGHYSYTVPAVQEMFSNGTPPSTYFLAIRARNQMNVLTCCSVSTSQWVYSVGSWQYIGPLYSGSSFTQNFTITPTANTCGNLTGTISDAMLNTPLDGVTVNVASINQTTPSAGLPSGQYLYNCTSSALGYRILTGGRQVSATKTNYYDYTNLGNTWYAAQPLANITTNTTATYNASIWPKGYGTVTGTVQNQALLPLNNISVQLSLYNGTQLSTTTGSNGQFIFSNVLETWPPPNLPLNSSFYNYSQHLHSIHSWDNSPNPYYGSDTRSISVTNSQTTNVIITLDQQGGL